MDALGASSSSNPNARRKEVWIFEMDKTAHEKSQLDKFREAARQLETDDDEKRFDERLGKIAKSSLPTTKDKPAD